jgi:hypothetical protein
LSNAQPPAPHCGIPQVPIAALGQTGKELAPAMWAAGTLSCFSKRWLPHCGHSGCSSLRINSSNSLWHFRQVYSYKGIAGGSSMNR